MTEKQPAAIGAIIVIAALGASGHARAEQSLEDLQRLSLEDLANIEISSVSKTAESLSDAPAAIYVITHDDIIRSGANSIDEMLRMAPNLQVARITSGSYAISARGFNGPAAGKLLVLIDGRSVYTPFFSGVYWDQQDVLPEDIEQIEVISGPGATLWGANAVNGVINIITRNSGQTQGGVLELGGGNLEQRGSLSYGGRLSDTVSYRAYVEAFHYRHDMTTTGANAQNGWYKPQGGFRIDWAPPGELVTLQADFYEGSGTETVSPDDATITGRNVLARWTHQMEGGSELQIQAYYDYSARSASNAFGDFLDTYDLDVQHTFAWGTWQQFVWGGGYRVEKDNFPTVLSSTQQVFFIPQSRTFGLANVFVQDSMTLSDSLKLVLGTKLEDDPYVGLQPLPSVRLSWKVTSSNLLWSAVSRAVRAPSRLDRDLFTTVGKSSVIRGGDFQSEKLIAYEIGYRAQPSSNASISISTFYNIYQDLRSAELSGGRPPVVFGNDLEGDTYGVELWGNYQVNDWWRLTAGFNWLHKNLHFKPGSARITSLAIAGNDPTYQASVRSSMNLGRDVTLDLDLRKIGALPSPASPSYTELDARVAWNISESLEISLTGSNLLHPHHLEFGTTSAPLQLGSTGVETERSFFLDTRWKF